MSIPIMPSEYTGKILPDGGGNKSPHREWTDKEIEWFKKMLNDGYSRSEIALSMGRTEVSVGLKQKRLGKKNGNYNIHHIDEKYEINKNFIDEIKPKSLLDLYAGESFYKGCNIKRIVTNDINKSLDTDYHRDAFKLICELYSKNKKFDMIDLDPFGSAYDCFDIAIKMARTGLVITLGELGHKRWKRFDFVRPHYGISNIEDFTIDNLISQIQRIGLCNKKELIVWEKREWPNIGRVWFKIKPYIVTEQWRQI